VGEIAGVDVTVDDDVIDGASDEEFTEMDGADETADSVERNSYSDLMDMSEAVSTVEDVNIDDHTDIREDIIVQAESLPDEPEEDVSDTGTPDIEANMDERYGSRNGHYNLHQGGRET